MLCSVPSVTSSAKYFHFAKPIENERKLHMPLHITQKLRGENTKSYYILSFYLTNLDLNKNKEMWAISNKWLKFIKYTV